MFYRLFFITLLFSSGLLSASCIRDTLTETRKGLVYKLEQKSPLSGCVMQAYPDEHKKSELYYHKGKPTGEGKRWYDNGKKESEIVYENGKISSKKLWNREGYLYSFEHYKNGKLLLPVEMTYKQAKKACQKAKFEGYQDWKLPTLKELHKLPFSDATREMTYIASNTPKKDGKNKTVSYVRFGGTSAEGKWDNSGLDISTRFNVICVREKNPGSFHLIMGLNGKADLTSTKTIAPKKPQKKVAKSALSKESSTPMSKKTRHTTLRPGYYIGIYSYTKEAPEKAKLDNIMIAGYRYKISDTDDMKHVLIGPFSTLKKVKKELKRVHQQIEPDAYIVNNNP